MADEKQFTNLSNTSLFEEISPNPSSCFGEEQCGHHFTVQHLVMDFKPDDEDTDFIQLKCCAFWDFVAKTPELSNYVACPIAQMADETLKAPNTSPRSLSTAESRKPADEHVALKALKQSDDQGFLACSFELKLPFQFNEVASREYINDDCSVKRTQKYVSLTASAKNWKKNKQDRDI